MQVLGGVHRDDGAQLAPDDPGDHLADDRHRAHHQADVERRGLGLAQIAGERQGFVQGAHDRLLGEDRIAGRERRLQVGVVQVVRRADHDEVERAVVEQGLGLRVCLTGVDPEVRQDGQTDRRGVDVAGHVQRPADLAHGAQHMRDTLAQPDDADAVGLHASKPLLAPLIREVERGVCPHSVMSTSPVPLISHWKEA